jgi:hypothetical protein
MRHILSDETLCWRRCLSGGASSGLGAPADIGSSPLADIEARVMVLAGGRDMLLPSVEEGRRLVAALPRAFVKVLFWGGEPVVHGRRKECCSVLSCFPVAILFPAGHSCTRVSGLSQHHMRVRGKHRGWHRRSTVLHK